MPRRWSREDVQLFKIFGGIGVVIAFGAFVSFFGAIINAQFIIDMYWSEFPRNSQHRQSLKGLPWDKSGVLKHVTYHISDNRPIGVQHERGSFLYLDNRHHAIYPSDPFLPGITDGAERFSVRRDASPQSIRVERT